MEVVSDPLRLEDMITVLSICKVVVREIRAGQYHFIVNPVQLYMLQSPTLINTLRYQCFTQSCQIRRMIHADFDPVWEFRHQRGQE